VISRLLGYLTSSSLGSLILKKETYNLYYFIKKLNI